MTIPEVPLSRGQARIVARPHELQRNCTFAACQGEDTLFGREQKGALAKWALE